LIQGDRRIYINQYYCNIRVTRVTNRQ